MSSRSAAQAAATDSGAERLRRSTATRFRKGLIWGFAWGLLGGLGALLVLGYSGVLLVSASSSLPRMAQVWIWSYDNLRLSIIPFAVVLVWYFDTLLKLRRVLRSASPDAGLVLRYDRFSELQSVLFFGIGVIWTAIGLRSALLLALDGLDARTAAQLGAFSILQRLVDGGILLALTTTIVGGVGGYLMRLIKTFAVRPLLDRYQESLLASDTARVIERLDAIERAVRDNAARTDTGSYAP